MPNSAAHPVFGANRLTAARAAYQELLAATAAVKAAGGAWASEGLHRRLARAREVRAMYAEYGDSVLDSVSVG